MLLAKPSWTPSILLSDRFVPPRGVNQPTPGQGWAMSSFTSLLSVSGKGHRHHLGMSNLALTYEFCHTSASLRGKPLWAVTLVLLWYPDNAAYLNYPFGSHPTNAGCVSADSRAGAGSLPAVPGMNVEFLWTLTLDIKHNSISSWGYDHLEDSDCCIFIFILSTLVSTLTHAQEIFNTHYWVNQLA